tara:strand:+ start:47748 stop:49577 length:1830 start_codon:yes stop_codon:yes gene_type:complete
MSWNLYTQEGKALEPLEFSNGKTQADVVQEVLEAIEEGHKIIFIKGMCGTGKSAIALNIAKDLGKCSVVVPVKYLQQQYQVDYGENMHIKKKNGEKLNITVFTGRNNHPCKYNKMVNADDTNLPCTIDLKKENMPLIQQYLKENSAVDEGDFEHIDDVRRLSVAAACPYWSPVIGKDWFTGEYGLKDAKEHTYEGLKGQDYTWFERKPGCSYYAQFKSYLNADILVFNSKKYEIENTMNRKPKTEVEIIDECDEFLDNLSNEKILSLDYLHFKLDQLIGQAKEEKMKDLLLEVDDAVLNILNDGNLQDDIQNQKIHTLKNSKVLAFMRIFLQNDQLNVHEALEQPYLVAKYFENLYDDSYLMYYRNTKENTMVRIVNVNLEKKLKELLDKNNVFLMMSGTLHNKKVLETIYGLKEFKVIDAEVKQPGTIRRKFTTLEKNFRYKNFDTGRVTREDYLKALVKSVEQAKKPILVHVNSYQDLPTEEEIEKYGLSNLQSRERLREQQEKYKQGELLQLFKEKKLDVFYSTKCSRGVDLPGDICNSIIFTKYPYPSMQSVFWKVLHLSRPDDFMDFYFDKAKREFLQRIYRGLRSKDDKIELLSPDMKVLESI